MRAKYNTLKMDLIELKNQINLNKKDWKHTFTTNCYAYALGLDIPERKIGKNAYFPGTIGNFKDRKLFYYTYSELLQGLYLDLDALGIDIQEIEPNKEISTEDWKIALFVRKFAMFPELLYDFHFLRQREDGLWYHKNGWYRGVNNKDSNHQIITNPEECYLKGRTYQNCFRLSLKKDN